MNTLLLTSSDVKNLVSIEVAVERVENAFRLDDLGQTLMPPKVYLDLAEFQGDFRAMPAYLDGKAALKWVSVYPQNPERGQPTVMATIILSDPATGFPLAVMDGTLITVYRTAAASAVASKYLARKNSKTLGLVGCGGLADAHIKAIGSVFDLAKVRVFCPSKSKVEKIARANPSVSVEAASLEAAAAADILTTLTPSRHPIVGASLVGEGSHINAVGADAAGKQELDPNVLREAKVFVDDPRQAVHSGEINVPLSRGEFQEAAIYAKLGEVVAGLKKGRQADSDVTVFDSTGLAIQDTIVAAYAYEKAIASGVGMPVDLIS